MTVCLICPSRGPRMQFRTAMLSATAALLLNFPTSVSATTQIVSGGKLTGATSVDVNGTLYDVEFLDGSCITVFGGCDSVSDLAFNTDGDASAAAQALLDQVFTGIYDTQP